MATSIISQNVRGFTRRAVDSEAVSWTAGTSRSVDITPPTVSGYTFLTALNPRWAANFGPIWMTINTATQVRIWGTPDVTKTNAVTVEFLYIR